ncbi:MAG: lysine--tRNA ligase [Acidimicrobiia bacterium]
MGDEASTDRQALADHPLTARRVEKLESIQQLGVDPYPLRFEISDHAVELHEKYAELPPGSETDDRVTVAGRLMGMRDMGRLRFGVLQDQSGRIQLYLDEDLLGDAVNLIDSVDLGDWLGCSGAIMTTRKGELSVRVEEVTLLAKSLRPLPEKFHGLQDVERRSRQRYLDLTVNEEARRVVQKRIGTIAALRTAFEDRGFIEVETPVLHLAPGGAVARPFVTHHEALDVDMYLRIALELQLKMLVVGGMERVFEIGRNFRNEGVDSTHSPEFTMLEGYQAYADYHDIAELIEQVLGEVAVAVSGTHSLAYQGREVDLTPPFRRATLLELVASYTGSRLDFETPGEELRAEAVRLGVEPDANWGPGRTISEVYEKHVEPNLWEPVFVFDHPLEVSPLARTHRADPNLAERFELFICGMEMANAFSELNDPVEQRQRFEEQLHARAAGDAEANALNEEFVLALEYGLPPTGGLGIGVDRLVMVLSDTAHIRDVQLFPHLRSSGS